MIKTLIASLALIAAAPMAHARAAGFAALAAGTISPNVPTRARSNGVSTHVTVFRHPNGELGYRVRFYYGGGGVGAWPTAPDGGPMSPPDGFPQ